MANSKTIKKRRTGPNQVVPVGNAPMVQPGSVQTLTIHESLEAAIESEATFVDSYLSQYPTQDLRRLFKRILNSRVDRELAQGRLPV